MKTVFKWIRQKFCHHDYIIENQVTLYEPDNERVVIMDFECSRCGHEHREIHY